MKAFGLNKEKEVGSSKSIKDILVPIIGKSALILKPNSIEVDYPFS